MKQYLSPVMMFFLLTASVSASSSIPSSLPAVSQDMQTARQAPAGNKENAVQEPAQEVAQSTNQETTQPTPIIGPSITPPASPSPRNKTPTQVWVNEAIVATYTFDYMNFVQQQREIARYFTAEGWRAYSQALLESRLAQTIAEHNYTVTAVATMPPIIKQINANHWQGNMTLLVLYKNPQYQQTQNLDVTITFTEAEGGRGVRGLAITSLQSKAITPPCECRPQPGSS